MVGVHQVGELLESFESNRNPIAACHSMLHEIAEEHFAVEMWILLDQPFFLTQDEIYYGLVPGSKI
ncbi:hypothetical protein DN757_09340 [Paenibacillus silvae]|uniref:Uncharacterized protein n=1 Tax=Paenibacillus silvae TaxID=1325358 RepID=A0A2W6NJK9_9BACL|nr:hypothetical protein DN757_09340 [Paenibacillus silvae]